MPRRSYRLLLLLLLFLVFIISEAQAVTLTSSQTDYTTTADITTSGIGISSSLSGSSSSTNKIKNIHVITTGNSGATSGSYGIRSSGNYNQITNAASAVILTTGSSGRGVSLTNNSTAINAGNITTQGATSYGIYAGGDNNAVSNTGSISTTNTTSYGIYLNGDNNSAINSGSIATRVYGIYGNGNVNQITNSGTITTSIGSSAHGIYVSAGTSAAASSSSYSSITNSGVINSNANGIYAKDNFTAITNSGTITTASGSSIYGIRTDGNNSTITNSGNVNSTNYAIYNSGISSVINNLGTLNGGIRLGDCTLNILGGNISGIVNGSESGNINIGSGSAPSITFNQTASFIDINNITIGSSSTLNSTAEIKANRILIDANSTLTINSGSSSNAAVQGVSNSVGTLNISGTSFSSDNSIGILGNSLANLNINSGGSVTSSGNIYVSNILFGGSLNFLGADNLTIFGNVAGNGSGIINIGSQSQTIAGNFSLNNGDELAVKLKSGGVGNLAVNGITNVGINSKLAITTGSNQGYITNGTSYSLVRTTLPDSSGSEINPISDKNISVNGQNSNVYGLLKFSTKATSDSLILNVSRLSISEITSNKNTQNIYQNLNDIGSGSRGKLLKFQEYLDSSGLSGDSMTKTINQLAPQSTKAAIATINNIAINSIMITENQMERIGHNNQNDPLKNPIWVHGFKASTTQKQIKDDDGYNANSSGIILGSDKYFSNQTLIGASFSFIQSDVKLLDNSKKNLINTYQTNIYHGQNFGKYFIDSIVGFSWNKFDSNRTIAVTKSNAFAKYDGQTYALKIKSGFTNILQNGLTIIPEISWSFLRNNIEGYEEAGADELNLDVNGVTADFLEGRAGLNFGYATRFSQLPELRKFSTTFKISYGHAFIADTPTTIAKFRGQNQQFNSQISNIDRDSLKLGTELVVYHQDNISCSANYNFEHKSTSDSHFILFKVREEF